MQLENTTWRSYSDACGTAHALELLGGRWTLIVMRELMFGPRRFGEIRAAIPGISANTLTQRLEELEANGLARRRMLPSPASVRVYELTDWGYGAEEIVKTLGRWAARSPAHDPTLPISPASVMMSLRTMFDAERGDGTDLTLNMIVGGEPFHARVDRGLSVARGLVDSADATVIAPPELLAGAIYGFAPPAALTVDGDREVVRRFTDYFALPPKAGA